MTAKRTVGWHRSRKTAPHRGKGAATVDPITSKKATFAIRKLLADRPRDLALFVCGINFGLRGGDLVRLRWDDLTTPECELKKVIKIRESKNNNVRRITLNKKVRSVLTPLLHEVYESGAEGNYVFPSRNAKDGRESHMTIQNLHRLVNQWCHAVGLTGRYGSHTLRKTFGYWCYRQGVALSTLMDLFGHSSERTTARYIGLTEQTKQDVYVNLNL